MLKEINQPGTAEAEIFTDGRTVWVNSNTGMCIGRFTRFGMDVHEDYIAQLQGKHCLDCGKHKKGEVAKAWERFVVSMREHYNIDIPENMRPNYAV